jgi:hypothetical protein
VITGRCVDSAVTLGALMHHFGWAMTDFDRWPAAAWPATSSNAAARPPAGCTDWERCPTGPTSAIPIVECAEDGSFTVTKPPGTGGLVSPATVAEQMLYEIGDPAPTCCPTWCATSRQVTLVQEGEPTACAWRRARQRPRPR